MKISKGLICTVLAAMLLASACNLSAAELPASSSQEAQSSQASSIAPPQTDTTPQTTEKPSVELDMEKLFYIPSAGDWSRIDYWIINSNGEEVLEEDSEEYTYYTTDRITDENKYTVRQHEIVKVSEGGFRHIDFEYSLCDLNGNVLLENENKEYSSAFGDYIIRGDNLGMFGYYGDTDDSYRSSLYHVPTGTELYEGTVSVSRFDDNSFMLEDKNYVLMGIVDENAEPLAGFPMQQEFKRLYTVRDYIIANSGDSGIEYDEKSVIMDMNFNILQTFDEITTYYGYAGMEDEYFQYRNGNETGIFDLDEGIIFSTTDAEIRYYDGELAIVMTGEWYSDTNPAELVMIDVKTGNNIAGGFTRLEVNNFYGNRDKPAERFIGIRDERVEIIDRTGNILVQSEKIPGINYASFEYKGFYRYDVELNRDTEQAEYGTGMLDGNLKEFFPYAARQYVSVRTGADLYDVEPEDMPDEYLLIVERNMGSGYGTRICEIYDHTGKLVIDNLSDVYDVGPNRIAVKRGFSIGLIDWDGNWIVKKSIFEAMDND